MYSFPKTDLAARQEVKPMQNKKSDHSKSRQKQPKTSKFKANQITPSEIIWLAHPIIGRGTGSRWWSASTTSSSASMQHMPCYAVLTRGHGDPMVLQFTHSRASRSIIVGASYAVIRWTPRTCRLVFYTWSYDGLDITLKGITTVNTSWPSSWGSPQRSA